METNRPERIDKGMIVLPPVSPTKHARLMAEVFPELEEAAAVEMGGEVRKGPTLVEQRGVRGRTGDYDASYERFKAITRRNSF